MIRCDGETISEKKTYSGRRVLELLNVSYQNGYRRGVEETHEKLANAETVAYHKGYQNGHNNAIDEIAQLKNALLSILGIGRESARNGIDNDADRFDFCPSCGPKMDGERREGDCDG